MTNTGVTSSHHAMAVTYPIAGSVQERKRMRKGYGKDIIVVLDRFPMEEKARFSSVTEAAKELKIPVGSIYVALSQHVSTYGCYFVYSRNLTSFQPKPCCWKRVRRIGSSNELRKLLKFE